MISARTRIEVRAKGKGIPTIIVTNTDDKLSRSSYVPASALQAPMMNYSTQTFISHCNWWQGQRHLVFASAWHNAFHLSRLACKIPYRASGAL